MGRTTLAIDAELLNTAMELGGVKTKTEVIQVALREYVHQRRRLQLLESLGTFDLHLDVEELRRLRAAD